MKRLALCAGLLIAGPVWADNFQNFPYRGQWEVRSVDPNYVAIVLIDSERRATWDSPKDQGQPIKFVGHVFGFSDTHLSVHFTDRKVVSKMLCAILSSELLRCHILAANGSKSADFVLTKVGPGPHRLTRAP